MACVYVGQQNILMKKNLLLSSLLLAVLASGAAAAQAGDQSEPLALPTYVVEAERQAAAEEHVNRSLDELRAQAGTPVVVSVELPALKAQRVHSARLLAAARVAKS